MKKVISLLLSAAMSFSVVATAAFAAEGNVQFSFDKDTYKAGEQITVTIDSLAKTISTDGFNVKYDPTKVEAVSILDDANYADGDGWWTIQYLNPRGQQLDREFSVHEINVAESQVAFGFANTDDVDYLEKLGFAKIIFKIKDDATGTATFTLNENSAGADGFVGVSDTKEITIESDEPTPEPAVNSVTIDQGDDPITVEGGQTLQLTATVDAVNGADATVTWSIDPETPATISPDGLFTAPAATEVDQVFTVKATSTFDGSKSDSIEITVPKKDEPQPQQPTTDITANNGTGGVYFDVTMNGNGEAITDANVVVAGPTADGEDKEVTFKVINYGDIQGELSFIIGILTDIAGDYTGTSNVTTGVGAATDFATVAFPAAQ